MVLAYFKENRTLKELGRLMGKKEGKGVATIQIAEAASKLGYKTQFYSKHVLFNEENLKMDFYKQYLDMNLIKYMKQLIEDAKKAGVIITERELSLKEILKFVRKDCIPIILLDWNVIKKRKDIRVISFLS